MSTHQRHKVAGFHGSTADVGQASQTAMAIHRHMAATTASNTGSAHAR